MHLFVHIYHKNLLSNFYKHLQILSIIPSPNPEKLFFGENTSVIFVSACMYIAKISSNMSINSIYNCLKSMVSTFTVCSPYYYGIDCITPCGHCRGDDVCNNVTGYCPLGCKQHWVGSKCNGTTLIFFFYTCFQNLRKPHFYLDYRLLYIVPNYTEIKFFFWLWW